MKQISVIVNMASNDKEGPEVFDKLKSLVLNFLKKDISLAAILPYDRDIPRMVRMQTPVMQSNSASAAAQSITAYARQICRMPSERNHGFFSRLFGKQTEKE
jgi:MinD-like ATPase involved in chromosome partitioning or flagellar assembly